MSGSLSCLVARPEVAGIASPRSIGQKIVNMIPLMACEAEWDKPRTWGALVFSDTLSSFFCLFFFLNFVKTEQAQDNFAGDNACIGCGSLRMDLSWVLVLLLA